MIKFSARRADGGMILGFGITEGNLTRLREGRPMLIRLAELEIPFDVTSRASEIVIFYGETEADIERDLQQFIGPETRLKRQ
jgi:hypothetical protein